MIRDKLNEVMGLVEVHDTRLEAIAGLTTREMDAPGSEDPSLTAALPDPAALAAAAAAFHKIDKNNDGLLSRIEVIGRRARRACFSLAPTIKQEDGSREAFEAVFQMIDADNSKTITLPEFLRVFGTAVPVPDGLRQASAGIAPR